MKIVYLLKDPLSNLPFYVGKGESQRPGEHLILVKKGKSTASKRLTSYLRKMLNEHREPQIEILGEHLTNKEALLLETEIIQKYGRVDYEDYGILLNHRLQQTDWTGKRHTEESKYKISIARKGHILSPQHKEQLRKANLGKKHPQRSDSWKQKQRESHIGRKDSPETFMKKSAAHLGDKNPRAKKWTLQRENGEVFIVHALKPWCKENQLSFDSLCKTKNTGQFYNGLKIIQSI